MPKGPLGFKRFSTVGPLTRETTEELRSRWGDCESNARDDTDVEICRVIKDGAVEVIQDDTIRPVAQTLEEINHGLCGYITRTVMEHFNNSKIREAETGGMGWMHYSIEYRGRFFDAESPTGVDDIGKLGIHKRRVGGNYDPEDIFYTESSDEVES